MEVKIGVQHAPRELVFDSQESQEQVEQQVSEAISQGSALSLTDAKGRRILVPADRIAYVEIGGGVSGSVGCR